MNLIDYGLKSRHGKLRPSFDHLAIVSLLLALPDLGGAFVIKQNSYSQELAELITNKQWPIDLLTALTYSV